MLFWRCKKTFCQIICKYAWTTYVPAYEAHKLANIINKLANMSDNIANMTHKIMAKCGFINKSVKLANKINRLADEGFKIAITARLMMVMCSFAWRDGLTGCQINLQ